jgi:hypothetical protein
MRRSVDQGYGRVSRAYEVPGGKLYDSVTSILGVIAKPALINWAANQERKYVSEAAADLNDDCPEHGPRMSRLAFLASLDSRLGKAKAHQKALEKAGDIGSQTHNLIEWNLRRELGQEAGEQPAISQAAALAFTQYEEWRSTADMQPKLIEQVVWSHEHEYAGTLDLFALARCDRSEAEGETVQAVLDWKTGKAIYPEAAIQISTYIRALVEMGHAHDPIWGLVVRLPKTEADPGFEVRWVSPAEQGEHFQAFLAAKKLWDWQQRQRVKT